MSIACLVYLAIIVGAQRYKVGRTSKSDEGNERRWPEFGHDLDENWSPKSSQGMLRDMNETIQMYRHIVNFNNSPNFHNSDPIVVSQFMSDDNFGGLEHFSYCFTTLADFAFVGRACSVEEVSTMFSLPPEMMAKITFNCSKWLKKPRDMELQADRDDNIETFSASYTVLLWDLPSISLDNAEVLAMGYYSHAADAVVTSGRREVPSLFFLSTDRRKIKQYVEFVRAFDMPNRPPGWLITNGRKWTPVHYALEQLYEYIRPVEDIDELRYDKFYQSNDGNFQRRKITLVSPVQMRLLTC